MKKKFISFCVITEYTFLHIKVERKKLRNKERERERKIEREDR
jgi:hypothetical protein